MFKENEAFKAIKEYLDNKVGLSELGSAFLKKLQGFLLIDWSNNHHSEEDLKIAYENLRLARSSFDKLQCWLQSAICSLGLVKLIVEKDYIQHKEFGNYQKAFNLLKSVQQVFKSHNFFEGEYQCLKYFMTIGTKLKGEYANYYNTLKTRH